MKRTDRIVLLLVVLLCCCFQSNAQAKLVPYHDSINHFSLLVPEGWKSRSCNDDNFQKLYACDTSTYTGFTVCAYSVEFYNRKKANSLSEAYQQYLKQWKLWSPRSTVLTTRQLQNDRGYWILTRDTDVGMCIGPYVQTRITALIFKKPYTALLRTNFRWEPIEEKYWDLYMKMMESFKFDD